MNRLPTFLLGYSNSAFTQPHRVLRAEEPVFDPGAFTFVGKEMDGLESQRHRAVRVADDAASLVFDPNHCNWIRIALEERSRVERIQISTRWFTGNQVQRVSVSLIDETGRSTKVLDRVPLSPDQVHDFELAPTTATECLVECYFDGGISRVHLFGEASGDGVRPVNLLADATVVSVSNDHYGDPAQAVAGVRGVDHMLGWESARTGFGEHALFELASPAVITQLVVDTYLHIHNAPLSFHAFGLRGTPADAQAAMAKIPRWTLIFADGHRVRPDDPVQYMAEQSYRLEPCGEQPFRVVLEREDDCPWTELVPFAPLQRDTYHRLAVDGSEPIHHLLVMFFPNGGIHGLKAFGTT